MLEELLASILLCWVHLTFFQEYGNMLDTYFLCDPENPLLLELEWSQSDLRHARALIEEACIQAGAFDRDAFGRFLLQRLQRVYETETLDGFCDKLYALSQVFPRSLELDREEPFSTFPFAGEPLTWGDGLQTRRLCEAPLTYYEIDHGVSASCLCDVPAPSAPRFPFKTLWNKFRRGSQ